MIMITEDNIIIFNYTLTLRDEIQAVNYEAVLWVFSIQWGLLQTTLNYGKIIIKLENNDVITIRNLPNPDAIAQKIDEYLSMT